jgi:hypothetical protein
VSTNRLAWPLEATKSWHKTPDSETVNGHFPQNPAYKSPKKILGEWIENSVIHGGFEWF